MKIIKQCGILFAVSLTGVWISSLLPFTFPASVLAMALLFLLLFFHLIKSSSIHETAEYLQKNMGILYLPAAVGIIDIFAQIKPYWVQMLLICLISTILTFAATAFTVTLVIKLQKGWRHREK